MANCKQCKEVFESKRADALYCSPKCRKTVSRSAKPETEEKTAPLVAGTGKPAVAEVIPETSTSESDTKPITTCERTEHPKTGCSICVTLKRDTGDNTAQCKSTYYDCVKWGVCIESYHREMCTA